LLLVVLVLAGLAAIRTWPRVPLADAVASSTSIHDAHGRLLRLTLAADDKLRLRTPLARISPDLVRAFLLHEDQWFHWHPGVNPVALVRGAFNTWVLGQPPQGGSTITMQLARLLYGGDTRTLGGKVRQVLHALWLEARYGKHDILDAYLDRVPFGANIEGVGAASLVFLGKPADALVLAEVLTLAVIPQSPARRVLTRADSASLTAARDRLAARWRAHHGIADDQVALLAMPLALRSPADIPFRAPHATTMLLRSTPDAGPRIDATIDLALQSTVERIVRQTVRANERMGVRNAAVMLLDHRSMTVRAMLGSADFRNAAIHGQVNGTTARRSPGSTLKPFIYALALDQGLIHPGTVLKDAPAHFGTFAPENFDGAFLGPLSAQEALIRSRNVPAVALAARLADPTLHGFLRDAGVTRLADDRRHGLALALGAAEVSMDELVRLYAMLANGGVLRGVRHRADLPADASERRLLSAEAAYITLDMLRATPRPSGLAAGMVDGGPVAWKTGTSWGYRDAWTIGVFGPYVLAVWVGNFDGASNPAFVGGRIAAPLFFRIVDAIRAQQPGLPEPSTVRPAGVIDVEVCAASGDLPNAHCPRVARTRFIPGRSPIRVSEVHRAIDIDVRTGRPACGGIDPRHVRTEVFESWPTDLEQVFRQAGLPRRPLPDAACHPVAGRPPMITSPLKGVAYAVRGERDPPLALAATSEGAKRLYWFADDSFIGVTSGGEPLAWSPTRLGRRTLRVVDEHGQADVRELRVVALP